MFKTNLLKVYIKNLNYLKESAKWLKCKLLNCAKCQHNSRVMVWYGMVYLLDPRGETWFATWAKIQIHKQKNRRKHTVRIYITVKEKDTKQYRQKPPNTELMIIKEFHRSRNKWSPPSLSMARRHQISATERASKRIKNIVKGMAIKGKNGVQFGPCSLGYNGFQLDMLQ